MRTTLDIDDDILQAAKELARGEKKTAGQVLSELARKGLTGAAAPASGFEESAEPKFELRNGWYVLPSRGGIVTKEPDAAITGHDELVFDEHRRGDGRPHVLLENDVRTKIL